MLLPCLLHDVYTLSHDCTGLTLYLSYNSAMLANAR